MKKRDIRKVLLAYLAIDIFLFTWILYRTLPRAYGWLVDIIIIVPFAFILAVQVVLIISCFRRSNQDK